MSIFDWDEFNLSLGISTIDDQHKKLFALINKIWDAGEASELHDLEKIVSELKDYTVYHFSAEIEYMSQLDYPKIDEHKKKHNEFVDKVLEYEEMTKKDGITPKEESVLMFNYLVNWLSTHIDKTDREYSNFIKK